MKASWNETQQIEAFLQNSDTEGTHDAMHVKMLCDTDIYEKVHWQKVAYVYVHAYGQEALKQEIAQAQKVVFERPVYEKFRLMIQNIFS